MDGLEPVISKNLMEYHYGKHHATYVNNLNGLYEKANAAMASGDTQGFVDISQGIKFNGGGHLNHEFFWESLSPVDKDGGILPEKIDDGKALDEAIKAHTFTVASLKAKLQVMAAWAARSRAPAYRASARR